MATEMVEYRPGKWVKVVDGRIVGRATRQEVTAWLEAGGRNAHAGGQLATPDLEVDLTARPADPARALDVPLRPAYERRRRQPPQPDAAEAADRPARPPAGQDQRARGRRRSSAPSPTAGAGRERTPPTRPREAERGAEPQPAAEEPAPSSGQGPRFWWIWNAYNQPTEAFLREWVPRYRTKFGREVSIVLCHEGDLAAVEACGYQANISPLLQPGHFYLGCDDST